MDTTLLTSIEADTRLDLLLVRQSASSLPFLSSHLLSDAQNWAKVHCTDGLDQALNHIRKHRVDIVLLDLNIGDIVCAISQIKDISSAIPVIIVGASDDTGIVSGAVKYGAQDYILDGEDDLKSVHRYVRYAIERERAEEALRRAYDELEIRVEERTESLRQVNKKLTWEVKERERTEQRLRSEHEFLSVILDTIDAVIMVVDRTGVILQVNRACEQKSGCEASRLCGSSVLDLIQLENEAARDDISKSFLQGGESGSFEGLCTVGRGAGRLIRWTSAPVHNPDGQVDHVLLTGIDITEQRQHEAIDRKAMLNQAHISRLTTMGEMTTEIAHELNQPLGAIASYSNSCLRLLDEENPMLEDIREALTEIEQQAHRSADIIKHIRSFVKKEPAHNVKLNMNDLVGDLVKLIGVEAKWNNVKLEVKLGSGVPDVMVDKILIEQVILNLVRNAIDAMINTPEKSRRLLVETLCDTDGSVVVQVSDSGPGVQDKDRLFEAFYTTKPEGMGMGLPISQSIVKSYKGKIWVDTSEFGGARFCFSLGMGVSENAYSQ